MHGGSAMKRFEPKKAAQSAVVSKLWREKNNSTGRGGLGFNHRRALFPKTSSLIAASCYECADGSGRRPLSANMPVPLRSKRCELGGLLHCNRRMTAAPALIRDVAFSFGGVRSHGLIAPALYRFCGLMPCGKPSGLPSPVARSANPHGVAHLLAERGGFRQSATGVSHE